jgi:serine/threonine-protein kinase
MPLLSGHTLDKLIANASHRLTPEAVVDMLSQACRGLHAAHERGLVHRDIKPSNIFVMDDDSVKIIDFGIARIASTQSKTSVKGTLFYLAPEFLDLKPPTPLSDQFALAVAAYEALTGGGRLTEPTTARFSRPSGSTARLRLGVEPQRQFRH